MNDNKTLNGFHFHKKSARMRQYVTFPLPPDYNEWPNNIFDEILKSHEKLVKHTNKPYEIESCICVQDLDGKWYVECIAAYVVEKEIRGKRQ
jgi:hypothetical protein